jgi:hypothetical protein
LPLPEITKQLQLSLGKASWSLLPGAEVEDVSHQHKPFAGVALQELQQGFGPATPCPQVQIAEE